MGDYKGGVFVKQDSTPSPSVRGQQLGKLLLLVAVAFVAIKVLR